MDSPRQATCNRYLEEQPWCDERMDAGGPELRLNLHLGYCFVKQTARLFACVVLACVVLTPQVCAFTLAAFFQQFASVRFPWRILG